VTVALNVNGTVFNYPQENDDNWGAVATAWATAVTAGMLQKAGGAFALAAEVDFGASFGVASAYYKSRTANLATSGQLRFARSDVFAWRNQANSANLDLGVNASDELTFNGAAIQSALSVSDTAKIDLTLAASVLSATIVAGSLQNVDIDASAAIAVSKLAAVSASRALASDASGFVIASAVTATELGFVSGVTSAIQTQIDSKQGTGNYITALTGDVTATGPGSAAATIANSAIDNAKVAAAAAIAVSKLAATTASRALASDASGFVTASSVTATELEFVSGVTSAIQTQLDARVLKTGDTMTGVLVLPSAPSASNPALVFDGGLTTGIFSNNSSSFSLAANGISRLTIGSGSTTSTQPIRNSDGTAGNPSVTFSASNSTGMFLNAANVLGFSAGGSSRLLISSTALSSLVSFRSSNGTVASPGIQFSSDAQTGFFRANTDVIGISTNNIHVAGFSSAGLLLNGSTSGTTTLTTGATTTSYTLTLPSAAPSVGGQVLSATTGGVASWINAPTPAYTAPSVQRFTSGSGTYTTPAGVVYIRVKMVGAGGGGFGANGSATSGGTGGNTTFGSSLLTTTGGVGASGVLSPGGGGTATLNAPALGSRFPGAEGNGGQQTTPSAGTLTGGSGGGTPFGGAGRSGANAAGGNAQVNTGSGGGGAGSIGNQNSGAGGGAGAFIEAIIPSPSATYAYAVGAGGAAGGGVTAGGAGAAGYIEVTEFRQ